MNAILRVSLLCVILLLSCSAFVDEGAKTRTTTTTTTTTTSTTQECGTQCDVQECGCYDAEDSDGDFYWTRTDDHLDWDRFYGDGEVECCASYKGRRRLQAKPVRVAQKCTHSTDPSRASLLAEVAPGTESVI